MNQKSKFALGREDNVVAIGENAAFSPFPLMFSKGYFFWVVKGRDYGGKSPFAIENSDTHEATSGFQSSSPLVGWETRSVCYRVEMHVTQNF